MKLSKRLKCRVGADGDPPEGVAAHRDRRADRAAVRGGGQRRQQDRQQPRILHRLLGIPLLHLPHASCT